MFATDGSAMTISPANLRYASLFIFWNTKLMVPEIEKTCLLFYPRKTYRGSLYRLGKDHRKSQMLYQPKVLQHPQHKNINISQLVGLVIYCTILLTMNVERFDVTVIFFNITYCRLRISAFVNISSNLIIFFTGVLSIADYLWVSHCLWWRTFFFAGKVDVNPI